MAPPFAHQRMTADGYFALPDDGNRYELIDGELELAPVPVVEVTSPTSEQFDRGLKLRRYARFGVTWYWLIDPRQQTIEELERTDREYRSRRSWTGNEIFETALFPGLRIDLTELWPESGLASEE